MELIYPDPKLLYTFLNLINNQFLEWVLLEPLQSVPQKTLHVKAIYINSGKLIMKGKDLSNSISFNIKHIHNLTKKEENSWTFFIKHSKFKHQVKIIPHKV